MSYTKEEIRIAIHLLDKTRSVKKVMDLLGYPGKRDSVYRWVSHRDKYISPEEDIAEEQRFKARSHEISHGAIKDCLTAGMSVKSIAEHLGYSTAVVYKWRKIFAKEGNQKVMASKYKRNTPSLDEFESLKAQIHEMQLEIDILLETINVLKKDPGIDLKMLKNSEKAVMIDALKSKHSLPELLSFLGMSRSSYYYRKTIKNSTRKQEELTERIKELFHENKERYGYRRIQQLLKREKTVVSEKVIRRIMKEENLVVKGKKKKKYNSYQGEITAAAPNVIARNFHADKPNQKWLTDITEFAIPSGKVYLSPIIDCFDGLPVSWKAGTSPNAELVNSMLDEAIALLKKDEKPIIHSDRGVHYRWPGWINRMDERGLTRSMSKKGCSPDNSACEGFFGILKNEMFYERDWSHVSVSSFIDELNNYIIWFREDRIKMSLGGLSPLDYRRSIGMAV